LSCFPVFDDELVDLMLFCLVQVEQFWMYYSHMIRPNDLTGHSDYHLFKEGIRPMWEVGRFHFLAFIWGLLINSQNLSKAFLGWLLLLYHLKYGFRQFGRLLILTDCHRQPDLHKQQNDYSSYYIRAANASDFIVNLPILRPSLRL